MFWSYKADIIFAYKITKNKKGIKVDQNPRKNKIKWEINLENKGYVIYNGVENTKLSKYKITTINNLFFQT